MIICFDEKSWHLLGNKSTDNSSLCKPIILTNTRFSRKPLILYYNLANVEHLF